MFRSTTIGALGVVFGLGSVLSQDIIIKNLSDEYSVVQLLFIRSAFALLILLLFIPFFVKGNALSTSRLGIQVLRGSLQFCSFVCYYIALKTMPILDLVAIFFTAPLIAVALSVPVLKEKVSMSHWCAVGLGFLGSLIMIKPGGNNFEPAITLFALGAASLYAGSIVATRLLGKSDQSVTTTLYTCIMYAALGGLSVMAVEFIVPLFQPGAIISTYSIWTTPGIEQLGLLALAGLAVCIAFLLLAYAYTLAPVSVLVPWEYSALIWGGLFGYIFLEQIPTTTTVLGAMLIVISGIYIARKS